MKAEEFRNELMDFPEDARKHIMRTFYFALAGQVQRSSPETPSPEDIIQVVHRALQADPDLRPEYVHLSFTNEDEPEKVIMADWLLQKASGSPLKNPSEGLSMAEYFEQRLDCYNWTPESVLEGGSRYLYDAVDANADLEGGWPLLMELLETGERYE